MDLFEGLLDDLDKILSKLENHKHNLANREPDLLKDVEDVRQEVVLTRNKIYDRLRIGSGMSGNRQIYWKISLVLLFCLLFSLRFLVAVLLVFFSHISESSFELPIMLK